MVSLYVSDYNAGGKKVDSFWSDYVAFYYSADCNGFCIYASVYAGMLTDYYVS